VVSINHPIMLMLAILAQVTLSAVTLYLTNPTSWASLILFLIYVGGLIVLFIYITSLASNEKFSPVARVVKSFTPALVVTIIFYSTTKISGSIRMDQTVLIKSLEKIFSSSSTCMVATLILYLFFILIVISAVVGFNTSTLRPQHGNYDKHSKK